MDKIPKEQVLKRIQTENSWWSEPHRISRILDRFEPRPYLELCYPLITNRAVRRAMVLMGPRRVGKTVLLHHAIRRLLDQGVSPKDICYFSVDHPLYNGLSLEQFLEHYREASGVNFETEECFVFFDEIQYLKGWEIHLKAVVDRMPSVKFIASGSAAAALKLKSAESGAGRFTDFLLPPLTFFEYVHLKSEGKFPDLLEVDSDRNLMPTAYNNLNKYFIEYLNFGGYPEAVFSEEIQADPRRFIKSDVIDKVLLRDLPSLYGIQDIQELNYLFTTLAFNTAQEVSLSALSQESGVSKTTIKKYIEYLEAAFLIKTVHRIDMSARRFQRANFFKVYLTNPSIRSALFSPVDEDDEAMGALTETAIFAQIFTLDVNVHYARWNGGEVDIVGLDQRQKVERAIEAKWSDKFFDEPDKLKSLIRFCHEHNLKEATVTTKTKGGTKTSKNVDLKFTPASFYCFSLGYRKLKEDLPPQEA